MTNLIISRGLVSDQCRVVQAGLRSTLWHSCEVCLIGWPSRNQVGAGEVWPNVHIERFRSYRTYSYEILLRSTVKPFLAALIEYTHYKATGCAVTIPMEISRLAQAFVDLEVNGIPD